MASSNCEYCAGELERHCGARSSDPGVARDRHPANTEAGTVCRQPPHTAAKGGTASWATWYVAFTIAAHIIIALFSIV